VETVHSLAVAKKTIVQPDDDVNIDNKKIVWIIIGIKNYDDV
jgi:hypothetical protein